MREKLKIVRKLASEIRLVHVLSLLIAIGVSVAVFLLQDKILLLKHWGYVGVFFTMLLFNASIILPSPTMVINIALGGAFGNPFLVGLAAGTGSAVGEITGYMAGFSGSGIVENTKVYTKIKALVVQYGTMAIFVLALIPNPFFDAAGMVAGAIGIKWQKFLLATVLGKTLRATVLALIGWTALG